MQEDEPADRVKSRDLERRYAWLEATGVKEAVPRHNEIKEPLARKILASLLAS
jgi:hypothetical protein